MLQQYPINSMRIIERLRLVLVNLGRLSGGGRLVQARIGAWAPLIFQDLFKKER